MTKRRDEPSASKLRKQYSIQQLLLVVSFVALVAVLTYNLLPALRYGDAYCTAYSPDGTHLAAGYEDGTVRLWNIVNGTAQTLAVHQNLIRSLAFSPDGRTLATGSLDTTVRLHDTQTGETLNVLSNQTCANALDFSRDGRYLAVGNWDYSVVVWDIRAKTKAATLTGHANSVSSVAFTADGSTLVSAGEDRRAFLWDVSTWTERARWELAGPVVDMAFSPDGESIAFAQELNGISLWKIADNAEVRCLEGDMQRLSSVAFSPDGSKIATGSAWENIHSLFPGNLRFKIHNRPSFVGVKIWEVATGKELGKSASSDTIWSVNFAPDGKSLAASSENWQVDLLETSGLKLQRTLVARRPYQLVLLYVLGLAVTACLLVVQTRRRRQVSEL